MNKHILALRLRELLLEILERPRVPEDLKDEVRALLEEMDKEEEE